MKEKDVLDKLLEFEHCYPVDSWVIGDLHIWPIIRVEIGNYMCRNEIWSIKKNDKKQYRLFCGIYKRVITKIKEVCSLMRILLFDRNSNDNKKKADVFILSCNYHRISHVLDSSTWFDRIMGPIEIALNKSGITVKTHERIIGGVDAFPRSNKTHIIAAHLLYQDIKCNIARFFRKKSIKSNHFLPKYSLFLEEARTAGINCDGISIDNLMYYVFKIESMAKYFSKLLIQQQAKCALLPDWRTQHGFALSLACLRIGIPCVEIQHGYYGQNFYTHYRWESVPNCGYEIFPTHYWCWTKGSADKINAEHAIGKGIVGFPPMALIFNNVESEYIRMQKENIKKKIPSGRKCILISLQDDYLKEQYPEWLFDFIKEKKGEYFWFLRKHPAIELSGQDEICSELSNLPDVEYQLSTKVPLLLLMQMVALNITMSSGTVIEASSLGIHSIMLDSNCVDRFREQIEDGTAYIVEDKEEFLNIFNKEINNNYKNKNITDYKMPIKILKKIIKQSSRL